jgi:DNA-directed RNA polymerase specialized sigma24 family protein
VSDQRPRAAFPTTRITLIEAARGEPTSEARDALSVLCSAYWFPIYAYIRRLGYRREDAEDLTQSFFARVLDKQYLRDFERERGRFRSFLLGALKHFVANERDWARARKRGGGSATLPLDAVLRTAEHRYGLEPRDDLSPDKLFERQWAFALLTRVQERLQAEADRDGKGAQFERLKSSLTADDLGVAYRTIAVELNTTEGAIKVVVHRLRRRFRELLREEIAQTVDNPEDVGNELRDLMAALRT